MCAILDCDLQLVLHVVMDQRFFFGTHCISLFYLLQSYVTVMKL